MVGLGIGWWLTRHFDLIQVIEAPIAPFVPGGKLMVMSLIDPFMIVLQVRVRARPGAGVAVGDLPALALPRAGAHAAREARHPAVARRRLAALSGRRGDRLVLGGSARPSSGSFNSTPASFNTQITYDSYVSLVITSAGRHGDLGRTATGDGPAWRRSGSCRTACTRSCRRYAFFLSFVGGAILSPTPEVVSMILFTIPLLLLYEVGVAGAWLVERRNLRAARRGQRGDRRAARARWRRRTLHAQVPPAPPPVGARRAGRAGGHRPARGDRAGRAQHRFVHRQAPGHSVRSHAGLPAARFRHAGPPGPRGFCRHPVRRRLGHVRRHRPAIVLSGHAATDRDDDHSRGASDSVRRRALPSHRRGRAADVPAGQAALIGVTMHFNTCNERGMIGEAYTSFNQLGSNWFMRGNLAVDSSAKRLYAAHTEFTSCDLPDPHYHFVTGQMKWVSQSVPSSRGRRCSTSATCRWRGCRSSSRTPRMAGPPAS